MEKESKPKDKKILTLFLISVFSLLIAMTQAIDNQIVAIFFQVVLILTQIVFVKNVLDSYMPEY